MWTNFLDEVEHRFSCGFRRAGVGTVEFVNSVGGWKVRVGATQVVPNAMTIVSIFSGRASQLGEKLYIKSYFFIYYGYYLAIAEEKEEKDNFYSHLLCFVVCF